MCQELKPLKLIIISFLLIFSPLQVLAVDFLDIIVNEIAWMGVEVEGVESKNWWRYEWLELYNNTNQSISLDGWKIELYRTSLDWGLELKENIPAQSYFLIVASDKIFLNYDLNYSNLGGKLNNSGQKVVLKDAAGTIIDEIDCSSGWFVGDNKTKQTMERKNPQLEGSDPNNWQTSQNVRGTPKAKNSIVTIQPPEEILPETELEPESEHQEKPHEKLEPVIYPSNIFLNEILPSPENPDAENEWIEIFNGNNFGVNVSEWQIRDTIGATKTYTIPEGTKIDPNGFLLLPRPETKITLQNSGDTLELLNPIGEVVHKVNYGKAPLGQSFNRTLSGWAWSKSLTPGEINIITVPEVQETGPSQISKEKEDKKLLTAGVGEKLPEESSNSLIIFLTAIGVAIISAVIVLILKRRIVGEELETEDRGS
ncbi:hypothetical protein CO121_00545 [bacterium (Candidatus Gribaldobacteria) CG_4_9_14_3_um_filter_36_15]|uniref:LTD domain-containing protein n=4 Tax=Candidatus Gribaldobacteria TaxID=2798536 RepID=A0A2M7ZVG2_9BACT|nr:MAG: hypothetical protein CO121_00545 [bacterium (Candidatus Gribaldobacteria) CG_4_9_14_3_um_filter_36_15]